MCLLFTRFRKSRVNIAIKEEKEEEKDIYRQIDIWLHCNLPWTVCYNFLLFFFYDLAYASFSVTGGYIFYVLPFIPPKCVYTTNFLRLFYVNTSSIE